MTANDAMPPRQPDEEQPLEQLFTDVLGLVDETVAQITDAEVSEHLRKALGQAGFAGRQAGSADMPGVLADPASLGHAAVADIVATAQANERLSEERLQQAQEALKA